MNFQVGDQVVDLQDIELWDNVYHHEKNLNRMKPKTVVAANEKFFTCSPDIDVDRFSGLSDNCLHGKVFQQRNGAPWDGPARMVNITRNKPALLNYLNDKFAARLSKCDDEDTAMIKRLEAEIAAKQKAIENIKAGKRTVVYDTSIIERDFVLARKQAILNLIG